MSWVTSAWNAVKYSVSHPEFDPVGDEQKLAQLAQLVNEAAPILVAAAPALSPTLNAAATKIAQAQGVLGVISSVAIAVGSPKVKF